ncbi:C1q-related factor [Sarotherodon galilaeus]
MDIRKKESGQRSTESERGETSTGEGEAEGEAEGEKGQQASSSQKEQGETEELQQMDQEAEEDQVITERGEQTGQERENDEAAAATHSTTGFDLGDKDTGPRQVKLKSYPHDTFGTQKRAFNHSWFEKHNWLEYSVNQNAAFCFPCRVFGKNIKHDSLVSDEGEDSPNGAFTCMELLKEFDPFLQKHKPPSNTQYILPTSQNDTIDCCAQEVTSVIVSKMTKSKVYAIMADKARNENAEQLAVCVRYVSEGAVKECFLALAEIKSFDAQSIANEIQQQIQNNGLAELKCVAQTYDGAAVMSGSTGGVQAHFRRLHPEAIYVHFYTHQVNLVLCNTCKAVPEAVELFSLLECVYSFFSTSLVNHHKFIKTQAKLGLTKTELVQLSNTHWACQLQSISAVLETLPAILECLSAIGSPIAVGLRAKLYKFSAVYALLMFQLILSVTEGLHKFLQKETLDLAEAFICKQAVCDTLKGKHSDAFGCVKQWVRKYFTDLQSCLLKKTRFNI